MLTSCRFNVSDRKLHLCDSCVNIKANTIRVTYLAEVEQEKKELRDQVDRLAVTLDKQSAQLNEMSKITLGLRDDLEKANKKYSGPMGFGTASDAKNVEVMIISRDITNSLSS